MVSKLRLILLKPYNWIFISVAILSLFQLLRPSTDNRTDLFEKFEIIVDGTNSDYHEVIVTSVNKLDVGYCDMLVSFQVTVETDGFFMIFVTEREIDVGDTLIVVEMNQTKVLAKRVENRGDKFIHIYSF